MPTTFAMIGAVILMLLPAACGYKGPLKSPTQIQVEQAKQAKKQAEADRKAAKEAQQPQPPQQQLPTDATPPGMINTNPAGTP